MKFKSLLNLIKIDSKRCVLLEDYDRKIKLDMIYTLLRRSRYTQKFIDNFINYECKDKEGLESVLNDLLNTRIQDLNTRIAYEKMFFENYSDTYDNINQLEKQIDFYEDIKERIKEGK